MKRAFLFAASALSVLAACSEQTEPADNDAATPIAEPKKPGAPSDHASTDPASDNPAFNSDMAYYFSQGARGPALSFGVPQTDNIALSLRCPPGAMGKTVLVSFNRPADLVAERPDTITLEAGDASQQLDIERQETQLGARIEAAADPEGAVMQAYRDGTHLSVSYGDETITIPSRETDREIEQFFNACMA